MAKKKDGPNKSEEVRKLLKANPEVSAKEVVTTLGNMGITVTDSLYYFIKGKMKGRKSRRQRAQKVVAQVATATASTNSDALKTILKVKGWAAEVGGLKKLIALAEALS
jgi:hypothetical protein